MTDRCPNCNQPVLESDTICWHCGWQLPKREPEKPEPQTVQTTGEQGPYPLSAVIIYAALTIAIIVATLLVMRSLGQKPLEADESEAQPGRGWVSTSNQNQAFAKPDSLLVAQGQDLSQVASEQSVGRHWPVMKARKHALRVGHQQFMIRYAHTPVSKNHLDWHLATQYNAVHA